MPVTTLSQILASFVAAASLDSASLQKTGNFGGETVMLADGDMVAP